MRHIVISPELNVKGGISGFGRVNLDSSNLNLNKRPRRKEKKTSVIIGVIVLH